MGDYHGDAAAAGAKAGSRDHDDPGATADHGGSANPGTQDGSSGNHSDGSANNHGPRDTGDHGSDYGDTDRNATQDDHDHTGADNHEDRHRDYLKPSASHGHEGAEADCSEASPQDDLRHH